MREQGTSVENFITTTVSRNEQDVEAARELWDAVYAGEFGWLSQDIDPSNDEYHPRSVYAVCRQDGHPVGTLRIVNQADPGFYITQKLEEEPLTNYLCKGVEIQRLMVRRDYRERKIQNAPFGIYGCLVKACFQYALATGMDWVLADCHKNIDIGPLKSMKTMGFRETGHSYRDNYNGEECIVLIIRTKEWVRDVVHRRTRFNEYLFGHEPNFTMEL